MVITRYENERNKNEERGFVYKDYGIKIRLNCVDEGDDGVTVLFGEKTEFFDAFAGVALRRYAMPHDSFHSISCATVVQTVGRKSAVNSLMQSSSPERSRAAPACADIVDHA